MADPVTAAVVIGGLTAATSAVQASQQNDAAKDAEKAQRRAAATQTKQLEDAATVEREKRIQEQRRISARLRVAAGESGLSLGSGTSLALQNQTESDLDRNLGLIDQNLENQSLRVQSGAEANIASLQSSLQNPLLSGFSGGLGGASTGLQIGGALQTATTPPPDPNTSALYQSPGVRNA